ncbi:MAG: hypothetical protein BWX81_00811 [Spirochaetes bacterium ADurb.Bin110]|nr:MAG: hypothetical protein BWX81_00811 [Spirochaetes bacterium ADurb.Bin110]
MNKKICFRSNAIFLFLVISVLILSPVLAQSTPSPQSQRILTEQSINETTALAALLDHMLDNHYLPSAQVALGSFTYADTQLPTPFARWFEDELRLALGRTSKMKLFDKQVAAAMDPAIREQYAVFFGQDRADSILYGKYIRDGDGVLTTLSLTDLATGALISETRYLVKKEILPTDVSVEPSIKTLQTAVSLSQLVSSSGSQASGSHSSGSQAYAMSDFQLSLSTDRGGGAVYRNGERLKLYLTSNKDAYLKIYHVDVNGVAQLIWPNRFGGSGKICAGEAMQFPGPNDKFQYLLGPPYGTEYIKAVASTKPFATMEADFSDLQGSAVEAITRGLSVVSSDVTRSEALVVYEIVP